MSAKGGIEDEKERSRQYYIQRRANMTPEQLAIQRAINAERASRYRRNITPEKRAMSLEKVKLRNKDDSKLRSLYKRMKLRFERGIIDISEWEDFKMNHKMTLRDKRLASKQQASSSSETARSGDAGVTIDVVSSLQTEVGASVTCSSEPSSILDPIETQEYMEWIENEFSQQTSVFHQPSVLPQDTSVQITSGKCGCLDVCFCDMFCHGCALLKEMCTCV